MTKAVKKREADDKLLGEGLECDRLTQERENVTILTTRSLIKMDGAKARIVGAHDLRHGRLLRRVRATQAYVMAKKPVGAMIYVRSTSLSAASSAADVVRQ